MTTVTDIKDSGVCEVCGNRDQTVKDRVCAYQREINDKEVHEVICDSCEQDHRENI